MITRNPKKILVADDSIFFRMKMQDALEQGGHSVRGASNGREVIEYLEKESAIDLLILDVHMPEVDGFQTIEWIDSNGLSGAFPILVVSTVYDDKTGELDRLKELGVSAFMTKSFSPQQVVLQANRLLFADKYVGEACPRERVPVAIPVEFRLGDEEHSGVFLNLSCTGAFLKTDAIISSGDLLKVRFDIPGSGMGLELISEVRWVTAGVSDDFFFKGGGISFSGADDASEKAIGEFVSSEIERLGLSAT